MTLTKAAASLRKALVKRQFLGGVGAAQERKQSREPRQTADIKPHPDALGRSASSVAGSGVLLARCLSPLY